MVDGQVGELAKSFLWCPFLPAHLEDKLFHLLLLLSKHQNLPLLPVIEDSRSKVIGFVTQHAVARLLLQSSGLEWFDGISDKALSEFSFASEEHITRVYGDQSLTEILHVFRKQRIGVVAFVNRENLSMKEFIHMETAKEDAERDTGAPLAARAVNPQSSFRPKKCFPITAKRSDTLKQAMNNLVEKNGNACFIIDDFERPMSMLTLRDVINEFAPPFIDSGIHGGSFFNNALEQAGCQVKNRTIVSDH